MIQNQFKQAHTRTMTGISSNSKLARAQELLGCGRLDEAKDLVRSACQEDKSNSDCWLLLGNICGQLQALDCAIESFTTATVLSATDPRAYTGLAQAYYAANQIDQAISACKTALELQPDNPDNWYLLATLHGMQQNFTESKTCLHRVTELEPGHSFAHRTLGYILQTENRLQDALESYRLAVKYNPDFVDAHNDMGVILQEQGHIHEAISEYRTALRIDPSFIGAIVNLGSLLLIQYHLDEAQKYFDSALTIDKHNLKALCGLGSIMEERGHVDEAQDFFIKARSLDPANESATISLARLQEKLGNHDKALALLQPFVDQATSADALTVYALLSKHFKQEDKAIELLEQVLDSETPSIFQRIAIHFSLGKLYDKKGEYDLAFHNLQSGNGLKSINATVVDHGSLVNSLTHTYSKKNHHLITRGKPSDRQPVFIVGMPRSGTSLAEQILSTHPDVQAAGELTTINRLAAHLHETTQTRKPYPQCALDLTQDDLGLLAQTYLADLPADGMDKAFFTDKMPHNFLHLGLIQQIFPNARIVHCARDARDTCFSCYSFDFNGEHPYAYDLTSLGKFYLQYRRIMKHWQATLDIPIYHLDYEQLVRDQEEETRLLLDFCGLDWNDGCLEFHTSKRFVLTSSYDQVRRPMYSSSIGRWRNYEKHLTPLLEVLAQANQAPT